MRRGQVDRVDDRIHDDRLGLQQARDRGGHVMRDTAGAARQRPQFSAFEHVARREMAHVGLGMALRKSREVVGDEAAHHLFRRRAFIFEQRVQISELDVGLADHRARGLAKADPARGARLSDIAENLSFVIADQLT